MTQLTTPPNQPDSAADQPTRFTPTPTAPTATSRPPTPPSSPTGQLEPPGDVAASPGGRAVASSDRQVAGSPPGQGGQTKRFVVRRGFDYYEDQLATLKKLSLHEQMEGRDGSMSRMVREALDAYLAKHSPDLDSQ